MKKIFIAIALLVVTTASYSQSVWNWGVKVGPNFSLSSTKFNVNGANQDYTGSGRPGGFAGAFIELSPGDSAATIRLQLEANYNLMYMKYNLTGSGASSNVYLNGVQQLNIPFLMRVYLTPQWSVNVGPSINVNLYAKEKIYNTTGQLVQTPTLGINSFKATQIGAVIGGAYTINKNWFADLRYNYLFGHINNTNGSGNGIVRGFQGFTDGNTNAVKWGVFQLGVGYRFGFK